MALSMRKVGAVQACRRIIRKDGNIEEWSLTLGPEPFSIGPSTTSYSPTRSKASDPVELSSEDDDRLERKRAAYYDILNERLPDADLELLPDLPFHAS